MRFALLGDPVARSRSPAMHAAAFAALGLPHSYEAIATKDIAPLVAELRRGAFAGFNVTVPHKARALELADDAEDVARRARAANTLVMEGARVRALNTDVPAIKARLRALSAIPKRAIVIGTGGAARAAEVALAEMGVRELRVRSRRETLAPDPRWDREATIVIQATSAGMIDPGDEVARAVAWDALPAEAVALEVIYARTPFLVAAEARGLRCEDGLAMLVEQGALSLERWLDVRAPREAMTAAVLHWKIEREP